MSNYTAQNTMIFKVAVKQHTERVIKAKLIAMLRGVAQALVTIIDNGFAMPTGTVQFPVETANLHDATGVGVYADGVIMHFVPTKRAVKAQKMGGKRNIVGSALLKTAISNSSQFAKGIWIVLFSTVPYAYYINTGGSPIGRGAGYFEALKQNLIIDVITGLRPITA